MTKNGMNAPPKKQVARGNWLVTLPLVGMAVLYTFFFLLPHQKAVESLRAEQTAKQNFIAGNGNLVAALAETRKELSAIREYNLAWERKTPHRGDLPPLLGKISSLAQEVGVHTTRFDPQSVVKHEHLMVIPLEIGFTGSFSRIFAFLREIERLPQTIWMHSVNMEKKDTSSAEVECEVVLEVFADNPKDSDRDDHEE